MAEGADVLSMPTTFQPRDPDMTLKGKLVETTIHIDCRCTGGPLIPKGTQAVVKVVRRTGKLWVEFLPVTAAGDHFGHRHVYGYLEGDWERGKHRKWCGLLTKEQFEGFVNSTGLIADSTETMGSIGPTGLRLRLVPGYFLPRRRARTGHPARLRHAHPRSKRNAPTNGIGNGSAGRF